MEKLKDYANYVINNISKGAFLTVKNGDNINTMTIGWGSVGIIWGKPIFMVMVRKSRYTYQLIENQDEFTISFPAEDKLKKELSFCGSNSGRDLDKFQECNLTAKKGKNIETPIIKECKLHFECKIKYKQEMNEDSLVNSFSEKWYQDHDMHTLYYGEIIDSYLTK